MSHTGRSPRLSLIMKKPEDDLPEWRIALKRADGQGGAPVLALGRIRARTADEAINTAIREFGIDEARRSRLIATRVK
jgi:hypothetical protein